MWSIFIGIGLGIFEIFLLKRLISMLAPGKGNTFIAAAVIAAKLFLVLTVLWIVAEFISLGSMIWCAAGVAATMILIPIILAIQAIQKYKKSGGEQK